MFEDVLKKAGFAPLTAQDKWGEQYFESDTFLLKVSEYKSKTEVCFKDTFVKWSLPHFTFSFVPYTHEDLTTLFKLLSNNEKSS